MSGKDNPGTGRDTVCERGRLIQEDRRALSVCSPALVLGDCSDTSAIEGNSLVYTSECN